MSRLAVPDLHGTCAVCFQDLPATPAEDYPGRARVIVHDHPRPEFGACIGSLMVVRAEGQLALFSAGEIARAA